MHVILAGHLEGIFCKGALGAWGMAPNRSSIQPDFLGFATIRCQATGFLKIMLVKALDLVTLLTNEKEMRNGIEEVNLHTIPSIIKQLSEVQADQLAQKMPKQCVFQCTMGVGSIIIVPPGFAHNAL